MEELTKEDFLDPDRFTVRTLPFLMAMAKSLSDEEFDDVLESLFSSWIGKGERNVAVERAMERALQRAKCYVKAYSDPAFLEPTPIAPPIWKTNFVIWQHGSRTDIGEYEIAIKVGGVTYPQSYLQDHEDEPMTMALIQDAIYLDETLAVLCADGNMWYIVLPDEDEIPSSVVGAAPSVWPGMRAITDKDVMRSGRLAITQYGTQEQDGVLQSVPIVDVYAVDHAPSFKMWVTRTMMGEIGSDRVYTGVSKGVRVQDVEVYSGGTRVALSVLANERDKVRESHTKFLATELFEPGDEADPFLLHNFRPHKYEVEAYPDDLIEKIGDEHYLSRGNGEIGKIGDGIVATLDEFDPHPRSPMLVVGNDIMYITSIGKLGAYNMKLKKTFEREAPRAERDPTHGTVTRVNPALWRFYRSGKDIYLLDVRDYYYVKVCIPLVAQ